MTKTKKAMLRFLGLTVAGMIVGSILSAFATALFIPHEGSIAHNLGWALSWFPMIPFVLTVGVPVSLTVVPWMAWPAVGGFFAWASGGVCVFRQRSTIGDRCAFGGSLVWAIILVPAAKMISSV